MASKNQKTAKSNNTSKNTAPAATEYEVDYNDSRFADINKSENAALQETEATYDGMINQTQGFYQQMSDAVTKYGETQKQNLQEQTDFAIEQIEQNKADAQQDFRKEASAAYTDWQKAKDDYGTAAEKMAASGLAFSGYSESSKVAMYNQYQQRVSTARQSLDKAVQGYNNKITEARLQNNSAMAELAYNTLIQSLQFSLEGFQYKNDLLLSKMQTKREIGDTYYGRRMDLVSQINTEASMSESMRQFNENQKLHLQQLQEEQRQYDTSLAEDKRQFNASLEEEQRQFNESQKKKSNVSGSSSGNAGGREHILKEPDETNDDGTEKEETLKIDKNSILALGYGSISAATLNKLVDSGEVIEYEENGVLKYRKATKIKPSTSDFLTTLKKFGVSK